MTASPDLVGAADLADRVAALPLDEKVRLLTGADAWSTHPAPALGLATLTLSDGPVGPRGPAFGTDLVPSLLFPSPSAMAATWDDDAVYQAGALMGAKSAELGVHVLLAPTVNLHRSPLGGRHFECYSEDPLLTARIAARLIEGVQSQGVAATIKHFVGNDSETERMGYDARIDEKTLREVYLPPFEVAVREARVWAVMAAYNGVNGESMTENGRLLTSVLKQEWGFDGLVMSDWGAARSTSASALAGLDLVMPGPDGPWAEKLAEAVRHGEVAEAVIDDKVVRLVRLAGRVGGLEGHARPEADPVPPEVRSRLRDLAVQGSVLLRNDGALPLAPGALRTVALIGPNAVRFASQGGGSAHVRPEHETPLGEALAAVLGDGIELTVVAGAFPNQLLDPVPSSASANPATGEPGVRLEILDADGSVIGSEDHATKPYHFPIVLPPEAAAVVLRTRLRTAESGTHHLSVLGAGEFTVTIDGKSAGTVEQLLSEPDFGALMLNTPSSVLEFEATSGEVDIAIRLRPQDGFPYPVTLLGVGYAPPRRDDDAELEAAVTAAREADVAIVVVGTGDEFERESVDRTTLALPGRQDELVRAVCAANPNTVVVVNAGAPVLMPWADEPAAVLWSWFPGQEGTEAVTAVLTGAEPGGRLPTTFPVAASDSPVLSTLPADGRIDYAEGGLIGYRGYAARGTTPLFPFGHGLSYTTWEYADLSTARTSHGVEVTLTVANTGDRPGRDVVQVYLESPGEPLRLIGYTPVTSAAGVRSRVTVTVDNRTLSRWTDGAWTIPPGMHRILVGRSAADLTLTTELTLA
ncbi:glycoside hydrolase family 3 C-terminal domain-containing protein [Yinghuangia sp. YIM S09857]|uniref:glycoside hydrolase family 3 C-terminal domain-containing protein n=1 Tax=Yinghuangia sp. YIM S09857 TaxID=3436929 RepID=UPI003F52C0F5